MVVAISTILNGTAAQQAPTFIEPGGRSHTCYARHAVTGQVVPVVGVNGNAGGFMGYATYDPTGWPTIIFDVAQLSSQPPIMWRFIYYHECAHLEIPTTDEVRANCAALLQMRNRENMTPYEEQIIASSVMSRPVLPPQYGGSGTAFWNATMRCVNGG